MSTAKIAYTDIPEAERFPSGARVKVTGDLDAFDGTRGREYVIEEYVTADERDDPRPYYIVDDPEGTMWGGCIPHDVLTLVKTPKQERADNRMPTPEEVVEYISSALHAGWDLGVNESQRLSTAPTEWPEGEHPFQHGVEFYGRREGGKSFGCVVRITALWETDQ